MCGRYSASRPPDLTEDTYGAPFVDEPPPPSWNVAPTDPVAIVVQREAREIRTVRWGLVPSWAKDAKGAAMRINARAETVATKPAFRTALARRRCLVIADGWYEWRAKQPFFIGSGGPLAFAGLYERWGDLRTCTIVTTSAAPSLKHLHDRMPVVLPEEQWALWLDPDLAAPEELLVPHEGFAAYPVSNAVNSVRNNGPSLVEPVPSDEPLF